MGLASWVVPCPFQNLVCNLGVARHRVCFILEDCIPYFFLGNVSEWEVVGKVFHGVWVEVMVQVRQWLI